MSLIPAHVGCRALEEALMVRVQTACRRIPLSLEGHCLGTSCNCVHLGTVRQHLLQASCRHLMTAEASSLSRWLSMQSKVMQVR